MSSHVNSNGQVSNWKEWKAFFHIYPSLGRSSVHSSLPILSSIGKYVTQYRESQGAGRGSYLLVMMPSACFDIRGKDVDAIDI